VTEVWETQADFEAWFDTSVKPAFPAGGPMPSITIDELNEVVTPLPHPAPNPDDRSPALPAEVIVSGPACVRMGEGGLFGGPGAALRPRAYRWIREEGLRRIGPSRCLRSTGRTEPLIERFRSITDSYAFED
jgi:hypothetical protein